MRGFKFISASLFALLLSAWGLSAAPDVPVLPKDPSVSCGTLPDGISYVIASDNSLKGSADFMLLQRVCQNVETTRFRDVPVYRGKVVVDSLITRIFGLISNAIEDDPENYGTDNQYIVIAGDVKASEMVEKLNLFSLTVAKSTSSAALPEYRWKGPYEPQWKVSVRPDGMAEISYTTIRRRTPDQLMGTVVPLVSSRMDWIFSVVLDKSIGSSFERLGIPYADLKFEPRRAWMCYGDESYSLHVAVRPEDVYKAKDVIVSIAGTLACDGVNANTYMNARGEIMASGLAAANRPIGNRANADRCAASLLYGTSLYAPMTGYGFFAGKEVPDSSQIHSFDRYMREILPSDAKSAGTVVGARVYTVNRRDTLGFPQPSKKKMKVAKTLVDPVSGGTIWVYENGMTVVYKKMATNGALYWSMVFNVGASDIKSPSADEAAFYGDMFPCADVGSYHGYDFRRLHEACGISMDCNVGLYDMALHGQTTSNHLALLMQTLQEAMNNRTFNPKAAGYAMQCARLGLKQSDMIGGRLYDKLHPGYLYTPYKLAEGLSATLPQNAETLFTKAFERADDGILILVGDRNEEDVQKILRCYMEGFRTAGKIKKNRQVEFTTVAGTVTEKGSGPKLAAVGISAAVPYTAENYFASKVLEEGIRELLSGYAAGVVVMLSPRPTEHLGLNVSAHGDVSEDDLLSALRKIVSDKKGCAQLSDWKTVVKNRDAFERTQPEYWIAAVRTRYTDAKDIATKSSDKIGAVTEAKVRELAEALLNGGRVVYYAE